MAKSVVIPNKTFLDQAWDVNTDKAELALRRHDSKGVESVLNQVAFYASKAETTTERNVLASLYDHIIQRQRLALNAVLATKELHAYTLAQQLRVVCPPPHAKVGPRGCGGKGVVTSFDERGTVQQHACKLCAPFGSQGWLERTAQALEIQERMTPERLKWLFVARDSFTFDQPLTLGAMELAEPMVPVAETPLTDDDIPF